MKRTAETEENTPITGFSLDRWRFMAPLITPKVLELARQRVRTGEKFFNGRTLTVAATEQEVKIALLIVHEMNPYEDFSAEEEALMRGISANTVRARKQAKELKEL